MPDDDQMALLREETETLADFLHMLQREYAQLRADFAAVLDMIGERVEVPMSTHPPIPLSPRIERIEDPETGAITFHLMREG